MPSPASLRWTLRRFGLTPGALVRRVWNPGAPKVLLVSVPKAGTHLVERALCLHPALHRKLLPTVHTRNLRRWGSLERLLARLRPGQVLVCHLPFEPPLAEAMRRHGVRGVFTVRDPRDVLVSDVHYVERERDHRRHDAFMRQPSFRDRLRLAIAGDPSIELPSIGEQLRRYEGWLQSGCLVVRFEDLVGPPGGGTDVARRRVLEDLFAHLGLPVGAADIDRIAGSLFSAQSPTFRRGEVGRGAEHFDGETEDLYRRVAGPWLRAYGYSSTPS